MYVNVRAFGSTPLLSEPTADHRDVLQQFCIPILVRSGWGGQVLRAGGYLRAAKLSEERQAKQNPDALPALQPEILSDRDESVSKLRRVQPWHLKDGRLSVSSVSSSLSSRRRFGMALTTVATQSPVLNWKPNACIQPSVHCAEFILAIKHLPV